MKFLKKINISYFATITLMMIAYLSCNAQPLPFEDDGLGYQLGDLHCKYTQMAENPMWLEIIQDTKHEKLQSVTIPEEMMIDGEGELFRGERPTIIERIGHKAFWGSRLKSIKIPSSVRRIGDRAFSDSSLENVEFSEGLIYLGDNAFSNNDILESIKLPESLRFIDYACFSSCIALKEVELPSTLISLGGFTFHYCGAIENIYCNAVVPPSADDSDFGIVHYQGWPVFEYPETPNFYYCVLHVPSGSEDLYKNAPGWKNFHNIVAIADNNTHKEEINADLPFEYNINGHTVTIPCNQNDIISVYDTAGICQTKSLITKTSEFKYTGTGVNIIYKNGKSIKIAL